MNVLPSRSELHLRRRSLNLAVRTNLPPHTARVEVETTGASSTGRVGCSSHTCCDSGSSGFEMHRSHASSPRRDFGESNPPLLARSCLTDRCRASKRRPVPRVRCLVASAHLGEVAVREPGAHTRSASGRSRRSASGLPPASAASLPERMMGRAVILVLTAPAERCHRSALVEPTP